MLSSFYGERCIFLHKFGTQFFSNFKTLVLLQSRSLAHFDRTRFNPVFFICRPEGFFCRNLYIIVIVISHFQKASFNGPLLETWPFLYAKAVLYGFLLFLQDQSQTGLAHVCFFSCISSGLDLHVRHIRLIVWWEGWGLRMHYMMRECDLAK